MKTVTPREFARLIKKERPNKVILAGKETAFIKRSLDLLLETWKVPPESLKEFYEPRELSLELLSEVLFSGSLFSQETVVVVREAWDFIKSLDAKGKRTLKSMVGELPKSTCLVLIDTSCDDNPERSSLVKFFSDQDFLVVNCRRARTQELKGWLKKRLDKLGVYDEVLLEALVNSSQGSIEALERELEKLSLGASADALSGERHYTPWELVPRMLVGDWEALDVLDYLIKVQVAYPVILSALQSGFRNILIWSAGLRRFPPHVERNFKRYVEKVGTENIKEFYREAVELEKKLKFTSSSDVIRYIFEAFVVSVLIAVSRK